MKLRKSICMILLLLLPLLLTACSMTQLQANEKVELTFIYCDSNIQVNLTPEESARVIEILDGNPYDPLWGGVPSCGFDGNISLKVGYRTFSIACDACPSVLDVSKLRYFGISQSEMDYIHKLFESYGGRFPCN